MPVIISDIKGHNSKKLDVEIDTGGGISSIPADLVKSWDLIPFESIDARGTFGSFKQLNVYVIRVKFENGRIFKAKVIEKNRPYVIIGRNVLNQMVLHADGPGKIFTLD
ncbi:MAG: hypothetical protein Q6353_013605 [Candidatus Sigynarchaeum springense]